MLVSDVPQLNIELIEHASRDISLELPYDCLKNDLLF